MKDQDNYVITLENFGKFEVTATNIFHALDTIKDTISKKPEHKDLYLKTTEFITISAFIIANNNIVDITDYI